MELKLDIYKTKICREIERTCEANDFELSLGVCEDVLDIINIDMFQGGLECLSDESMQELALGIVKNGLPLFKDIIKEIFDLTDEEIKRVKISDIAKVVVGIVKYSFSQLASSLGNKKGKNE